MALEGSVSRSSEEAGTGGSDLKQEWCAYVSILDIQVWPALHPPFQPPFDRYIEEALMGLQGGVGDTHTKNEAEQGKEPATILVQNVETLKKIITGTTGTSHAANQVCTKLFWIVFGIIFKSGSVASSWREELAQNWYMLTLDINTAERKVRDWIFATLPFIFAQVLYRVLYDAFDEDRKHFMAQGEPLLDKITTVTIFEVTGFQITLETSRKERRRIFLKSVVRHPHADQMAFLQGQKRQEFLESQNDSMAKRPLSFGSLEGVALENAQLEHVLENRQDRNFQQSIPQKRRKAVKSPVDCHVDLTSKIGGHDNEKDVVIGSLKRTVPSDLSVDRYEALAASGEFMFQEHLSILQEMTPSSAGHEAEEDDHDETDHIEVWPREVESTLPTSRVDSPSVSPLRRKYRTVVSISLSDVEEGSPPTSPKNSVMANDFLSKKERKEKQLKERRLKQEEMAKDMKEKPLPFEYRESELITSWVSPVTQKLYFDADDRFVLRKPSSDAFKLKMDVPACFYEQRPLSMPPLQLSPSKAHIGEKRLGSAMPMLGRSGGMTASHATCSSTVVDFEMSTNTNTISRTGSAPTLWRSAGKLEKVGGECIPHEPARSLDSKIVVNRLGASGNAFQRHTFAEYAKEYDILTGAPKTRTCPQQLERLEKNYLRKMNGLVAGRALRATFAAGQLPRKPRL